MIVLKNLKIWDGEVQQAADTLVIDQGRITGLGEAPSFDTRQAIDCSGLTALPGLIDGHVHLELDPDRSQAPERTEADVVPRMAERAAAMARAGITTARDLGGGAWYELALRDRIARGELTGPRLLCSGQPITCPGGHCHFWGGEAASLDAARDVLSRQVEHGVDLIKIMTTGGRLTRGSAPTDVQFDGATLRALVDMARSHQLPVAAHCHGTEGIRLAAEAGVHSIEHCSWVGAEGWASDYQDDVARIILERGVWVSPTVNRGWQRMLDNPSGQVLGRVRTAYKQMIDLGIPMLASTDAGIPGVYHADLAHALVVFAAIAELANTQALRAATADAADALGVGHITGRLTPGRQADVLIVDGDPTADLTALTRPARVYCNGQLALGA